MITFYWLCYCLLVVLLLMVLVIVYLGFSVATLICFFCLLLGGIVVTLVY